MHQDFEMFDARPSQRTAVVTRRLLNESERLEDVRPRAERLGLEPTRAQYQYTVSAAGLGQEVAIMSVIELEPGLAFVASVWTSHTYQRCGLATQLHAAVLRDFGALAVEDFCASGEYQLLARLADNGREVSERTGVPHLGIHRHNRLVERMFIVS